MEEKPAPQEAQESAGTPLPPPPLPGAYSAEVVAKKKIPFAVQAARFAFWAPLVGLVFGIFINLAVRSGSSAGTGTFGPEGALIAPVLNLACDLASIVLAIVALMGIRKYGTRGILVRSILGIVFSVGILLLFAGGIWVTAGLKARMEDRMVGTWRGSERLRSGSPMRVTLTLDGDHHGNFSIEAVVAPVSLNGQWEVAMNPARLEFWFDRNQNVIGDGLTWSIKDLGDTQVTLEGKESGQVAETIFSRVSPQPK